MLNENLLYIYLGGALLSAVIAGTLTDDSDDDLWWWFPALLWPAMIVAAFIIVGLYGPFWIGRKVRIIAYRPEKQDG